MIGKTWDDLLWLYLAGQLSDEDRALFERLLAENPERRAELTEWETLSHAVQDEADSRVADDALPALTPQFFARLDAEIAKPSMNGSHHHKTIENERQPMIETIRPIRFNRIQPQESDAPTRFRPSWTLAAAMIAVVLLAGLLYTASKMNNPEDPTAPGFGAPPDEEALEQRASDTPLPTFTPVPSMQVAPPMARCYDDQAYFQFPTNGTHIVQPIQIVGTAHTDDFSRYTIEIARVGEAQATVIYEGVSPVNEPGTLAQFDPVIYEPGTYRLWLMVYDSSDSVPAGCQVLIEIGHESLTATPEEFFIVTATPVEPSSNFGLIQADEPVTVHDAPFFDSAAVATLEPGAVVSILGRSMDGTWFTVQLENQRTGWIRAQYVVLDGVPVMPLSTWTPVALPLQPTVIPPDVQLITATPMSASPLLPTVVIPSVVPPSVQIVTATPVSGATLPPTPVIPSPVASVPPHMVVTVTSVQPGVQLATIVPTVPPPQQGDTRNPAASITPSQLQPIVSAPARLVSSGYVPQGGAATSIDWSGDMLAVSTFDSVLLMQPEQLNSGSNVVQLSSEYGFVSVVFSPDGSLLAALDWNSSLSLWHIIDRATHERVIEIAYAPLWGDLIFSADGTRLTSTLGAGSLFIEYAMDSSIETLDMNPVGYEQTDPYISPDFTRVVDGYEQQLTVIDAETREEIAQLPVSLSQVDRAVFSHDNAFLAVVSSQTVGVIEIETGELVGGTAARIDGQVVDLAFSPDDRFLAYITNTGSLNSVWVRDLAADATYAAAILDRPWNDLEFSPDSELLAVASSEGLVITLEIGR